MLKLRQPGKSWITTEQNHALLDFHELVAFTVEDNTKQENARNHTIFSLILNFF